MQKVAIKSGVILDPVYSGKAAFSFLQEVQQEPEKWKGKRVLFVHTGGLLVTTSLSASHETTSDLQGLFAKTAELQPLVESMGTAHRFHPV